VYNWVLEPAEAGDLTKDGSTAYISWNTEFEGTATLTVNGENGCGVSSYSDALEIIIDNTVGINDLDQFNTKVLPNPANGIFNVYFNAQGSYTLSVFNTLGERIYHSENNLTEEVRETVNLSNYSNGLYYLVIEGDNAKTVKKIIIDK